MSDAPDYWPVRLDGAWAIRSHRGLELEQIDCLATAEHRIAELREDDPIAAQDEAAWLDDFEAEQMAEAA